MIFKYVNICVVADSAQGNQDGVVLHLNEREAEMHLCNPLLEDETFVLSRLILSRVLATKEVLLYLNSHAALLNCCSTAENL